MQKAIFVLLAIALCISMTVSATTTAKALCTNKAALQGCYKDCNDCFGIPVLRDACHTGCYIACSFSTAA